jgi:hypothetical protein
LTGDPDEFKAPELSIKENETLKAILETPVVRKKTFFCQNLGPTVGVLSYYGSGAKVKALLNRLSKKTAAYYQA